MNRTELSEEIAGAQNIAIHQAKTLVDAMLNAITKELARGEDVNLTGFGNFIVAEKAARIGRNPSNGESVNIPAKMAVKFKPSLVLKGAIQKKLSRFKRAN